MVIAVRQENMFACPIFVSFGELAFVKERYRSTRVLKANSLRKTQARVLNRLVFGVRERRLRGLRHFTKTSQVLFCSISTLNYSNSNNNRGSWCAQRGNGAWLAGIMLLP